MTTQDYLHLYIGQECKTIYGDIGTLVWYNFLETSVAVNVGLMGYDYLFLDGSQITLILRPLSDMTEDEEAKWIEIMVLRRRKSIQGTEAERTAYLLSSGFDLFNLIESGLAIDKTAPATDTGNI